MFWSYFEGSSKEQSAPPVETLAIEDAPAVIVDAEKGSKNCGVEELIYLDGKEALDRAVTMLEPAGRGAEVYVRAYSFDQPDVVQAVQAALVRGSRGLGSHRWISSPRIDEDAASGCKNDP